MTNQLAIIFTGLLFSTNWDTPSGNDGLWQLQNVSNAFNRKMTWNLFILSCILATQEQVNALCVRTRLPGHSINGTGANYEA